MGAHRLAGPLLGLIRFANVTADRLGRLVHVACAVLELAAPLVLKGWFYVVAYAYGLLWGASLVCWVAMFQAIAESVQEMRLRRRGAHTPIPLAHRWRRVRQDTRQVVLTMIDCLMAEIWTPASPSSLPADRMTNHPKKVPATPPVRLHAHPTPMPAPPVRLSVYHSKTMPALPVRLHPWARRAMLPDAAPPHHDKIDDTWDEPNGLSMDVIDLTTCPDAAPVVCAPERPSPPHESKRHVRLDGSPSRVHQMSSNAPHLPAPSDTFISMAHHATEPKVVPAAESVLDTLTMLPSVQPMLANMKPASDTGKSVEHNARGPADMVPENGKTFELPSGGENQPCASKQAYASAIVTESCTRHRPARKRQTRISTASATASNDTVSSIAKRVTQRRRTRV